MKYYSIIILFFAASCGYGQFPRLHINEKGKVVGDTRYKGNDVKPLTIGDGGPLPVTVITYPSHDTAIQFLNISNSTRMESYQTLLGHPAQIKYNEKLNVYEIQDIDTTYSHWKKYLFYRHEADKEMDKIRKQRNPSYKEYYRLMDSVVRYKKLIDKLEK